MFEANTKPKVRLRETIESGSDSLMTDVTSPDVAKMARKTPAAASVGSRSIATRGTRMATFESARRIEIVEKEGRTKRCRYRRARSAVAEPYR